MKQNHKNKKDDTVQQISKSDIFLRKVSDYKCEQRFNSPNSISLTCKPITL